jgi:hypothetical protein
LLYNEYIEANLTVKDFLANTALILALAAAHFLAQMGARLERIASIEAKQYKSRLLPERSLEEV